MYSVRPTRLPLILYLERVTDFLKSQSMYTTFLLISAKLLASCIATKLFPSAGLVLVTITVLIFSPENIILVRSVLNASVTENPGSLICNSTILSLVFFSVTLLFNIAISVSS